MIDTHCHIDDPQYQENLPAFLQQQKDAGVEAILVPGVDVHSIDTVLPLCAQYPDYLYPALGLHPEEVKEDWQQQWHAIEEEIRETHRGGRLIAIGEIGLDYHWDTTYKEQQHIIFREQLLLARRLNLPVMVHIRDAMEDTYRILHEVATLKDDALYPLCGVIHCFSGSREMAEKFIAMGFYLGIGGVLTFKNCKLADTLRHIPLQHLVLETDAPYMAPVPHRGQRNESRWMTHVAERLADIYPVSTDDVKRVTTANARALFGIK
ncbi:MAG: TatD family hydrolase [Paludibacteraceae bacterium]